MDARSAAAADPGRRRALAGVGVVAIGRNEGERLRRCLASLLRLSDSVVYVDSGSIDGSEELARVMGAHVVALDMGIPFTAARARNAGWRRLCEEMPGLDYVQFVDGDCEVVDGWLEKALAFLRGHRDVAAVCGRRRERFPGRTVYNLMCDIEWNTPVGEARACGGDVMMRLSALREVGGFRADLIAGEEPELCVRLRAAGWRIWRLDEHMTLHDADMTRFGQWWKRSLRGGYAFAQIAHLHGDSAERPSVRESRRAWAWGVALPVAIAAAAQAHPAGLLLALAYPLQVLRLAWRGGIGSRENWWHACFLVLGRIPEGLGQLRFALGLVSGRKSGLIEYK